SATRIFKAAARPSSVRRNNPAATASSIADGARCALAQFRAALRIEVLVQQQLDRRQELVDIERLQPAGLTHGRRLVEQFFVSGDKYDGHVGQRFIGDKRRHELRAAQVWNIDIEDEEIGAIFKQQTAAHDRVFRQQDLVARVHQVQLEQLSYRLFV